LLEAFLTRWGYEVTVACDGDEAWGLLQREDAPHLAILDWIMPFMGGLEICRKVREAGRPSPVYLILLTARTASEDVVRGLESGANDYVTKPFNSEELRARVQVGVRMLELQASLAQRVRELEEALANVKQLQALLPICSYCKKIRDDDNYWQQIESYISEHSGALFSHGICPDCFEKFVKPELDKLQTSEGKP
jgi:sigma-B regulation protein RsbU (phosphoserine phosphatase)